MKKIFGVDLGGTTVKMGLFDENGEAAGGKRFHRRLRADRRRTSRYGGD